MEYREFINYVRARPEEFEYVEGEYDGVNGIVLFNKRFDTETHFTQTAIRKLEIGELITHTHQGRNIEQMTRVTGYFSKVSGWNKGKQGELKERVRTPI